MTEHTKHTKFLSKALTLINLASNHNYTYQVTNVTQGITLPYENPLMCASNYEPSPSFG